MRYYTGNLYRVKGGILKKVIFGIILTAIGLVAGFLYIQTMSFAFAFLTLITLLPGAGLIYFSVKGKGISFNFSGLSFGREKEPEKKINAINFYAEKLDDGREKAIECKFEYLASPGGIRWKHRRWGNEFYINVNVPENHDKNIQATTLMPIFDKLPDQDFNSPEALVKAAYLPANTNLARHSNDKEYKLSAWVLFAVICVEIIGLIIIP